MYYKDVMSGHYYFKSNKIFFLKFCLLEAIMTGRTLYRPNQFITGLIESLFFSLLLSLIICILRFIGLKYKLKLVYRISVYLFENL